MMEREELKSLIKEALREFLEEHAERWESLLRRWMEEYPPPPFLFYVLTRREFRELRENLNFIRLRLESWAPVCSEREKIENIQEEVRKIAGRTERILKILENSR